jgi:hypothetical protein
MLDPLDFLESGLKAREAPSVYRLISGCIIPLQSTDLGDVDQDGTDAR